MWPFTPRRPDPRAVKAEQWRLNEAKRVRALELKVLRTRISEALDGSHIAPLREMAVLLLRVSETCDRLEESR